jgi:hypothetical protein
MKSLWKNILDGLTYQDLAGKRQLRAYAVITLAILILLGLSSSLIFFRQMQYRNLVDATPVPVNTILPATAEPTATQPAIVEPYEPGCPTDPAKWSFADPVIPQNYKIIQPACVYQGLEKTIAWALAVREGYSRAQATVLLGFNEMPMRQLDRVKIPAPDGIMAVPVSFIPTNQNFAEWRMNTAGGPAVTYALRGCFRTSTVAGNRVETWGGDYPVICVVVEDAENNHILYSLEGHFYTSTATPMRSFLLFGYLGNENWVWLGTQSDPKLEIVDPAANANDRLTIATLYDSQPWDAKWLEQVYQLKMLPLPEGWQEFNNEYEKQVILGQLSADMAGVNP